MVTPALRPEFVAGFAVAEGCFVGPVDGRRFAFTIGLGAVDATLCDDLRAFFDVGRVYRYPRRKPHHDDVAIYTVQSMPELVERIVPFMDQHLPPSARRRQFLPWRKALLDRYSLAATGSSVTSVSQSSLEASDQRRSRS